MGIYRRMKKFFKGLSPGAKDDGFTSLMDFLGLDKDMDRSALKEATYYTCCKVLSEAIGKLPLKLIQRDLEGNLDELAMDRLYETVNIRPNPYMTASSFWSTVEYHRNHFGNAFVLITGSGQSQRLWILDPAKVEVWYDDAKLLSETIGVYYIYNADRRYVFENTEVLHFKSGISKDGIMGVPVRETLADNLESAKKAQKLLNKLYSSGFTAKAVLNYTADLNAENEKKFLQHIERYAGGQLKNEGIENIIPIPFGSKLEPLNMKLTDSEFLEVKKYTAVQIASAFGIKPTQIGDYTKSSYASAEAQNLAFYVDTLLYIVKQYEEELTYKLLTDSERRKGMYFKFNIDVILRADYNTKVQALSTAVNSFLMTPNEARKKLDLGKKDGGDSLLGNGASIPVQLTGLQYTDDPNRMNGGDLNG